MYLKKLYNYFGNKVDIKFKINKNKNSFYFIVRGLLGQITKTYSINNFNFFNTNKYCIKSKIKSDINILSLVISKKNYKSFIKDFEKLLIGVSIGWGTVLNISGRGFNFKLENRKIGGLNKLFLRVKIGYSHFIFYELPPTDIFIQLSKKKTKLVLFGLDYWKVWKIANQLRAIRSLHVYKIQGIFFDNEKIILKPGKQKQI